MSAEEFTLAKFREKFKVLHENWGYGFAADPNYEAITHGNFRVFQHLTDFLMRYLYHGFTTLVDQQTMTDVVFYKRGSEFNVPDAVFRSYLDQCGKFFLDNRNEELAAHKYLKRCDPSSTTCLLRVSLKWARVIRKNAEKHAKGTPVTISGFTEDIKAAALTEIEKYLDVQHSDDIENAVEKYNNTNRFDPSKFLNPDTVKGAITAMIHYYDPESSDDDYDDDDDNDDDDYGAASGRASKRMRINLISDVVNTKLRF